MKKLFYILILITGVANAQIVNIPDANFKAALIDSFFVATDLNGNPLVSVDTNQDGEIQVSEALNVGYLYLSEQQITSLEGILSFENLVYLEILSVTNLESLNISNLSNLNSIYLENLPSLTSINFSGLTSLKIIRINEINNLSTIDLSGNTSIEQLYINNGSLASPKMNLNTLNLTGCTSLKDFIIDNTTLTTIDLSSCVNLESIVFRKNDVLYLDLSGLINLQSADLSALSSDSILQTINVNGCVSLTILDFSQNYQLETVYMKNGVNEGIVLSLPDNPNLKYICADESQISGLQNNAINQGYTELVISSYCTFTPGGNYNTIVGQIQFDEDNNGCDVNDVGFPNVRINITDGTESGASFSNTNGGYTFYSQALNHELSVTTENPTWFNISPTTASVSFTDINNNQTIQNFCITSNGVHDDVEVVIVPTIPARPGFDATYKIVYRNKGNTIAAMNSGISLTFNDDLMDFLSSTQTVAAQNTGFLAWDVTSLLPFESKSFEVVFNINAPTDQIPVNNDDVLTFTSIINVSNNDENIADNTFVLNQTIVGSYDPNDITCLEGDIVSPTEIGEYLHYNIRFENTGTFFAENIVVKTEINPAEFDINTLQLLNASHAVDARIRGNIVEFIFQGIYLDTGGHGNVLLKVKTKPSLQIGDLVKNKANIYFDYNFPILTNDAETVFQSLSNPDFEIDNSVKIYPNPSNALVNIKSDFNIKSIQLYDVQGRILQTNIVDENTTSLDITSKAKGIYFLKVITDKGIKVEKLVKE